MLLWIWNFGGQLIILGYHARSDALFCVWGGRPRPPPLILIVWMIVIVEGRASPAGPTQAKLVRGIPNDSIGGWLQSGEVPD
jgi:hypothetical protein